MNPAGEWARLLFDSLARAGVRDVVVSPGSRSTAFVHAAVSHPGLRCHDVIDERAAAFFALGRARASGHATALLCTSGTAAAHYLPAVMEAAEARLPLLVLSADRPGSLHHCGANQTVDQVGLFGSHVRWFADVGLPRAGVQDLRALRRLAVQAVVTTLQPEPGPVHLNLRAEKPLEPGPAETEADRAFEAAVARVAEEPLVRAMRTRSAASPGDLDELAGVIGAATRGLVVCGPAPSVTSGVEAGWGGAVLDFCRRTGFALLAESTSQVRFAGRDREGLTVVDGFDAILRSEAGRSLLAADLVIQVGPAPVSGAWDAWMRARGAGRGAGHGAGRVVLTPWGWPDPAGTANHVVVADVADTLSQLGARVEGRDVGGEHVERLRRVEQAVWTSARDIASGTDGALTEAAAVRALVRSLPSGAQLAVGNSLAVRQLDAWCPGDLGPEKLGDLAVLSQRGVSGIDGLVAGGAGAADVSQKPTVLLLGDVSFLHDVGGLAAARGLDVPYVVLVVQNDGGRIFEQLPVARAQATRDVLSHWTTPHGLDLSPAAALYGHRYARVADVAALDVALREGLTTPGCTVIEAVVPASGAREDLVRLHAAVERACAEVGG